MLGISIAVILLFFVALSQLLTQPTLLQTRAYGAVIGRHGASTDLVHYNIEQSATSTSDLAKQAAARGRHPVALFLP